MGNVSVSARNASRVQHVGEVDVRARRAGTLDVHVGEFRVIKSDESRFGYAVEDGERASPPLRT